MKLSREQDKALDLIQQWLRQRDVQSFSLGGYAGTGKTTLMQHFINGLDNPPLCLAPTGKAASVLQSKLANAKVSTVHSALYKPVPPSMNDLDVLQAELLKHPDSKELQEAVEAEKRRLANKDIGFALNKDQCKIMPGQLVIIDEASMVTRRMLNDLIDTGAMLLFVGDPGQLPPVSDDGFFCKNEPDVMLTEVHRQALDSPIVRLSMDIREGSVTSNSFDDGCQRMNKKQLAGEEWLKFDQVLTGRNETRRRVNRYFRKQLGHEGIWPQDQERLICLKNDTKGANCYINGIQATAVAASDHNEDFQDLTCDLLYDNRIIRTVPLYMYPFEVHYNDAAIDEPWQMRQGLQEFDYAYAITVHKSQGSEWDSVLLADDGMMAGQKDFRKRWLYTAVTRAKKELVWVTD